MCKIAKSPLPHQKCIPKTDPHASMIYPGVMADESPLPPGVERGSSAHARYLVWLDQQHSGIHERMEG